MKITNVDLTPVNIPMEIPYFWTAGLYPGTSKLIIEIETNEGITGLGEAPSTHLAPVISALAERLIGQDPLDIAHLESLCAPPGKSSGIQMTVRLLRLSAVWRLLYGTFVASWPA
jgi:glucarate dehydratase